MKDEQLLSIFEIHKEGNIRIEHHPFAGIPNISLSLEDFYRMIKLKMEKEAGSVHMD